MKTIAYLDCPTGISGDMCLGAVIDAGVPLDYLQSHLDRLGLGDEFRLSTTSVLRQGLQALKANVELLDSRRFQESVESQNPIESQQSSQQSIEAQASGRAHSEASHHHHHHHANAPSHHPPNLGHATRHLPEIEQLITAAHLPDRAQRWSLAVFRHLAQAEAAVHGIPIDQVHFHEVGATDAIVDIVGTCLGLDHLGIDTLVCSPLPTGSGRVKAAHGWLPVPAPAVLKLLEQRQVPLYSNGLTGELVTPTGAAIATTLAASFGDPPAMTLQQVGLGAGGKDFPSANILRLWIGNVQSSIPPATSGHAAYSPAVSPSVEATSSSLATQADVKTAPDQTAPDTTTTAELETVAVLETQVDDMVPQAVGYLYDRLLAVGARDVFTQPVAMKKSRPGLLITVICDPEDEARCTEVLFAETPTLGIRHQRQQRTILRREFKPVETPYGPITVKLGYHPHRHAPVNVHPEYEDCAAIARQHQLPWQQVYDMAISAWYQLHPQAASTLSD